MSNITYDFENSKNDVANLVYITKAKYEGDWNSLLHFHSFTEIIFVLEGEGHVFLNDERPFVKRGDLVVINANCIHTEKSTLANPLSYIILGIDNVTFELLKKDETTLSVFDMSSSFNYTKNLLNLMIEEISSKQKNYRLMLENLLNCFILFIKRKTELYTKSFRKVYASKECLFVRQYIDTHYNADITLNELSIKTNICKNHLLRTFKKFFGLTPMEYLCSVRINEGRILLERTEMTVSDISSVIGFSNPSRFAQKFCDSSGVTPKEYRRNFLTTLMP